MRKYTQAEKIEVLSGREAQVINEHFEKVGKYQVSAFSDEEKDSLLEDLNAVSAEESKATKAEK